MRSHVGSFGYLPEMAYIYHVLLIDSCKQKQLAYTSKRLQSPVQNVYKVENKSNCNFMRKYAIFYMYPVTHSKGKNLLQ